MREDLSKRLQFFLENTASARSMQSAPGLAVGSLQGPFRKDNQDRAIVAYMCSTNGLDALIGVICDGMGGMEEGGAAATLAASEFLTTLALSKGPLRDVDLEYAVRHANNAVYEQLEGRGGSTLTALIAPRIGRSWIVHVGDSRVYSVDQTNGISLLTKDDTLEGAIRGKNADEDALDNRLLQFVGLGDTIEPHILQHSTLQNQFLITSDGTHGLGRKVLEGILHSAHGPADWVRKLTYIAEATSVTDNASAIALSVADFVPTPQFNHGLTLMMWSPVSMLELWIEEVSQNPQINQRKDKKFKPKPRTKPKRSTGRKTSGLSAKPGFQKPQLSIKFGGDGGSDD